MANQAFLELCNKVYNKQASFDEMNEFRDALAIIASKGASPQAVWELNQIIVKQAQQVYGQKLDFLNYIAEVIHVGHGERIEFNRPKGRLRMKWSARGTTVDYQRVGDQKKLLAEPVRIAGGVYYEIDQLLSGNVDAFVGVVDHLAEDMNNKVTAKAVDTLHTAMSAAPAVNKFSNAGLTLSGFNGVATAIQRYNRKVACVADIQMAKNIAGLILDQARMSPSIKDSLNDNGLLATVQGVDIVVFNNPFTDETNTKLYAPKQYAYVLPAGAASPLKIGFEGDLYQMTDTDIDTERVFLKTGAKVSVDVFDTYYVGELNDTTLA